MNGVRSTSYIRIWNIQVDRALSHKKKWTEDRIYRATIDDCSNLEMGSSLFYKWVNVEVEHKELTEQPTL